VFEDVLDDLVGVHVGIELDFGQRGRHHLRDGPLQLVEGLGVLVFLVKDLRVVEVAQELEDLLVL
jgi:hypothetical protein